MYPKEKLVPGGIFEPVSGRSFLFFGNSNKTSDFLVDGLLLWWEARKQDLFHVKQLVINLDNGPECNGHRSQFLYPIAEFADSTGLVIRLIYYPPPITVNTTQLNDIGPAWRSHGMDIYLIALQRY